MKYLIHQESKTYPPFAEEVDGEPVVFPGFEECDFFQYCDDGCYAISEKITGCAIVSAVDGVGTAMGAYNKALEKLSRNTVENIKAKIAERIPVSQLPLHPKRRLM